jgi:glycosyltransferase involved in cell wall biosynthesis
MGAMRVVIDASTWGNARGFGRYTRSLVGRLLELNGDDEYVLLFDQRVPAGLRLRAGARAVAVPTSAALDTTLAGGGTRALADLWRMAVATARQDPDVVFFPSVDAYFPIRPGVPTVVTVHDAIPEDPELSGLSAAARRRRRLKMWLALRQAARIVVDSEPSRRDVCRHYHLARERTTVVTCGADDVFRPPADLDGARAAAARLGARPPYLLYVGGPARHKNVAALIAAFALVARRGDVPPATLAMVGPDDGGGAMRAAIAEQAAAHHVEHLVSYLGFRGDDDLATLYQGAEALVLPSLKEGFGLTALEAVACGTPAVVTRNSPLPELLGAAAVVIDPRSEDDIARGLAVVLGGGDACARLRAAARARSGAFSWSRAAHTLRDPLSGAAAGRRRPAA